MARMIKGGSNLSYQALSLMSRLFYEKFGEDALPTIKDVWYEMGLAAGDRLKEKLPKHDFEAVAHALSAMDNQQGERVPCEISDKLYHVTSEAGYSCDVGLGNSGRPICEAVMSVNQGYFNSICGRDVEMNIVQSVAAGDPCCEIVYRPIDSFDD